MTVVSGGGGGGSTSGGIYSGGGGVEGGGVNNATNYTLYKNNSYNISTGMVVIRVKKVEHHLFQVIFQETKMKLSV